MPRQRQRVETDDDLIGAVRHGLGNSVFALDLAIEAIVDCESSVDRKAIAERVHIETAEMRRVLKLLTSAGADTGSGS